MSRIRQCEGFKHFKKGRMWVSEYPRACWENLFCDSYKLSFNCPKRCWGTWISIDLAIRFWLKKVRCGLHHCTICSAFVAGSRKENSAEINKELFSNANCNEKCRMKWKCPLKALPSLHTLFFKILVSKYSSCAEQLWMCSLE